MTDSTYIEPLEALFSISFLTIKSSVCLTFSLWSDSVQDFSVFPSDYAATVLFETKLVYRVTQLQNLQVASL